MFMMQSLQKIKDLINSFVYMEDKKKQKEMVLSAFFVLIMLLAIFSTHEFSKQTLYYFYPRGDVFNNILYLFLSFNWWYFIYIIDITKYNIIFFLSNLFLIFFNSNFINNVEHYLFILNKLFFEYGDEDIKSFIFLKKQENSFY